METMTKPPVYFKEQKGKNHINRRVACETCGAPPRYFCAGPGGKQVAWFHKDRIEKARLQR